jgi:integrase
MPISDFKSVDAIHDGKKLRGIYSREIGTFEVKKGAVKITVPEHEYSFDFTVGGKRYRSIFGRESEHGKIGATGKWESTAVEDAVNALVRFRENATTGTGPTSIKEELELARKEAEERKRKESQNKTVEDLVKLFLEDIAISAPDIKSNKPRTIKEYRLNLYRDVVPAIGKIKAKDIERRDIAEIIEKIVKRKKITQANRTLAACSRLFNWALAKDLVSYNPCARLVKYTEKARERSLTEPEKKEVSTEKPQHGEIKALWEALTKRNRDTEARILLLCLLTGARSGEICRMKWEDIDDDNWWTVHRDEIKTDVTLEVYMTSTALGIIGPKKEGLRGYVFPMATNKKRPTPVDRLSKYVREENEYFGLPKWQPRDLRRTFTTLSKGQGFSDLIVNLAQARRDRDGTVIGKHYDTRRYYAELRQLFETVEREILRVTGQRIEPGQVIKLRA